VKNGIIYKINNSTGEGIMRKVLAIFFGLALILNFCVDFDYAGNAPKKKPPKKSTWHVNDDAVGFEDGSKHFPFNTIQEAVDAAADGDEVKVEPGMYMESVTITKSIKVKGKDATILCPTTPEDAKLAESSAKYDYLVGIFGGTYNADTATYSGIETISVEFEGFTLDANFCEPSERWCTVLLRNANKDFEKSKTKVKKCELINILIDGKQTFGILGYGTMDIEVRDNSIDGFSRGGIGMYSGVAKIEKNYVSGVGLGEPTTWAPNGIQMGYGASGTIKDNEVAGCGWPGTDWSGTGIMVVDTSDVKVEKNWVHHNETGIGVTDFPEAAYGSAWSGIVSNIEVKNNVVEENEWGIDIVCDSSYITVKENEILDNIYDGIDVYSYQVYWPSISIPAPTYVVIENNSIVGNGGDGLWVGPYVSMTVNAEMNWWGDASGPGGDGPGTGDTVVGNADYIPWATKAPKKDKH
jgi:parallel beta-helix repeat protein